MSLGSRARDSLEPFRRILYLNYFLRVTFKAIFEAVSYIVLKTAKIVTIQRLGRLC